MSTLKADTVTTKSDDTDLTITGGGTGVPNLEAGFKVGGTAGVPISGLQVGTDGELITWDASGDPATVAVGTATYVLTSNGAGAAPTFQEAGGGGQWSLKTSGSVSAASNLIITGINKRIFIFCQSVTLGSTANLEFDMSPDSGSSWPKVNWVDTYQSTGSTSLTTTRGSGTEQVTMNSALTITTDSENMLNCWVEIPDPPNTLHRQSFWYKSLFSRISASGDMYQSWGFGTQRENVSTEGPIDQVRFQPSTGTLSMDAYYVWEQG